MLSAAPGKPASLIQLHLPGSPLVPGPSLALGSPAPRWRQVRTLAGRALETTEAAILIFLWLPGSYPVPACLLQTWVSALAPAAGETEEGEKKTLGSTF